ncbi:B-cell lymphoma 6 protein-like isoform X1 [Mya arenaria]|uniref:B-cell lymphoma 6 protein-like isoform X1 n=1 Tax=Mya arenaria TaxID=6604 RepID=UPI0022E674AC|nr:B-cell lymphoma 6 protein-like isoform X1 [Mya arenaria]XP_052808963.1 B-cell lymphoma 6 protein-like isoform X1 [Mya arenaria]
MGDMDAVKSIPGYEAILKSVLKNQIKTLVDQLYEQTGEEVVLLTASLKDGTFSNLGSQSGKNFLENHSKLKTEFYGYCVNEQKKHPPSAKRKQDTKLSPIAIKKVKVNTPGTPVQPVAKKTPQIIILPTSASKPISTPTIQTQMTSTPIIQTQMTSTPIIQTQIQSSHSTAKPGTSVQVMGGATQGAGAQDPKTFIYFEQEGANFVVHQGEGEEEYGDFGEEFEDEGEEEEEVSVTTGVTTPGKKPGNKRSREYRYKYKPKGKPITEAVAPPAPAATISPSMQKRLSKLQTSKLCCELCGKVFVRPDHLKSHMTMHSGESPFACKHCGISYRRQNNLDIHVRQHHSHLLDDIEEI